MERSKGILERELGLSEPEAYQALQHQSQEKKRSLKEIARAFILSATVKQSIVQSD
jgi:uroporphyrinogen-III synthase